MVAVKILLFLCFHFVGGTAPAQTDVHRSETFFLSAGVSTCDQALPATSWSDNDSLTENCDDEEEPDVLVPEDDDENDTELFSRKTSRTEKCLSAFDAPGLKQSVLGSSFQPSSFEPFVHTSPCLYLKQQALRI